MVEVENTPASKMHDLNTRVSILDESLFTGEQKQYRILCTVDPGFISIAAVDPAKNKFCGFEGFHLTKPLPDEQFAGKMDEIAAQSEILRKVEFSKVSVQFAGSRFTLIPAALFKAEDAAQYFYFNHRKREGDVIHHEVVSGFDAVNVFALPELLLSGLRKMFDKFSVHHHLTALAGAARLSSTRQESKSLFIHVHGSHLDLIAMEERKLLLANTYPLKSAEDGIYFVMMVCEQLALHPEKTSVIVCGEVDRETAFSKQLHKYLHRVTFSERIRTAAFTYGFDTLPPHYYYAAFSHILCES